MSVSGLRTGIIAAGPESSGGRGERGKNITEPVLITKYLIISRNMTCYRTI
jgi:hypothetical protein